MVPFNSCFMHYLQSHNFYLANLESCRIFEDSFGLGAGSNQKNELSRCAFFDCEKCIPLANPGLFCLFFTVKLFTTIITNLAFSRDISASMTSCVCFPGLFQLTGGNPGQVSPWPLGSTRQEVTIITQTIEFKKGFQILNCRKTVQVF